MRAAVSDKQLDVPSSDIDTHTYTLRAAISDKKLDFSGISSRELFYKKGDTTRRQVDSPTEPTPDMPDEIDYEY